jgi:hypothetical protein
MVCLKQELYAVGNTGHKAKTRNDDEPNILLLNTSDCPIALSNSKNRFQHGVCKRHPGITRFVIFKHIYILSFSQ